MTLIEYLIFLLVASVGIILSIPSGHGTEAFILSTVTGLILELLLHRRPPTDPDPKHYSA